VQEATSTNMSYPSNSDISPAFDAGDDEFEVEVEVEL
jgi:hypothetical protein